MYREVGVYDIQPYLHLVSTFKSGCSIIYV